MSQELSFGFDNEYTYQYYEFINSRDFLDKSEIGENHHIYPKSIFGDNNIIVRLSYMDHFKAHWILAKIYETQGMKREYMQMAKAFFTFIQIKEYRKEVIKDYSEEEIDELSILIIQAREQNRLSSIGELNPFYGKTHSPETIAKIVEKNSLTRHLWESGRIESLLQYYKTRDYKLAPRFWYYDPVTLINQRFTIKDVEENKIPENLVSGRYTPIEESLVRSLAAREFYSTYNGNHWKSGEDHQWYGTRHVYNSTTGERKRIKASEELPDGFIYSFGMTEEHRENVIAAAFNRRGKPCPWIAEKINKNPEKIRKTAEKHRGMKRSDENKHNMSLARNEFFKSGGESSTKGTTRYFDLITRKFHYITKDNIEMANKNPNLFLGKLFKVKNIEGNSIFITESEKLPEGYSYAKHSGR